MRKRKTHCVHGHPLEKGNVYRRKDGRRQCKPCARKRSRINLARLRKEGRAPTARPEYFRQYRADVKQGLRTPQQRKSRISDPYTIRVLDALHIDGGWLTIPALAMMLDAKEDTMRQTLGRMRSNGFVESRFVELGVNGGRNRREKRIEWRAVADLDQVL